MLLCWASGMTFHLWKSQCPSHTRRMLSGLKPGVCTTPRAKGWKQELHTGLCAAQCQALLCDQTTSSSISVKRGKFKSRNVLLPEKDVHVMPA